MQRWERDRELPETVSVLVQRAAEGERLRDICRTRGWPYSLVAKWISEREDVSKAVEGARRIWADDLATETVGIADGSGEGEVPKSKHRTDVRFKLAGFLDRARFGEQVQHNVSIDPFGEMLKRVSERNLARLREAQGLPALARPVQASHAVVEHDLI